MGREALKILLKGRPDSAIENPKYLAEMVEVLAWLSADELTQLVHPRTGLQTVCKFLPTPADVHGFFREIRARQADVQAKRDAVKPAHTSYRKLLPEDVPYQSKGGSSCGKATPFPRLTEAFNDQPELLQRTFETLCDASRVLGMNGREAAEAILKAGRSIR
jgi:hypothetical protein